MRGSASCSSPRDGTRGAPLGVMKVRTRARGFVAGSASVACGAALVIAPRPIARAFGLPARPRLAFALGVRDVAIGALLLARPVSPIAWLARGVSDTVDAVLIARGGNVGRSALAAALGAFGLVTWYDVTRR